ncbi:MAG: peptidylprolyl isomerase [Planctomycetaceae bacterium]
MNRRAEVDAALVNVDFAKTRYVVAFETSEGPLNLEFWPDVAPGHCKNLIGLAKIGFYDGIIVHRVISDFVIQMGCPQGTGTGGPGYQIKAEFNDRLHEEGVLSMARTSDPNSAGSQFFVCLGRVPHLDKQYTAFGKLADAESIATLRKIGATETDRSDRPRNPVTIIKGTVLESPLA